MARQRRHDPQVGGTLVLDADAVTKAAANDRLVQAFLTVACKRDARVVMSAITITEALGGGRHDADIHRVLSRVSHIPVTTVLARSAGELLVATGIPNATVDAVVAATALAEPGPVVLLTSSPDDLGRLTKGHPSIAVHKI